MNGSEMFMIQFSAHDRVQAATTSLPASCKATLPQDQVSVCSMVFRRLVCPI